MSQREMLDRLVREQREERPRADALIRRETSRVRIPESGAHARSDELLARLYADDFVAREKKPFVVDTRASAGPFLVSVDSPPVVLLDACSQIATLTHGFAHPGVVQGIHEGRFDGCLWHNPDTNAEPDPVLRSYAEFLLARAPSGLEHAAFVAAGGAEANEKAFRIARMQHADADKRHRVLAFEQSFHGRTWVSLGATWNPIKRGPFELPGYKAVFCKRDLAAVEAALREHGDEIYAAILEPMQAEGGDVHLDVDFVAGVRALTRAAGIPLIADEVQTGFHTGREFFWWNALGLPADAGPDLLTCAKKAGLGVVLSRWADPEPAVVNVASALRGLIHAESAGEGASLEGDVAPRLEALAQAHPDLVENPRAVGTTFAFELPDKAQRDAFIAQRYQRGLMTYGAGERTLRFRLNASFKPRRLDDLFARIGRGLDLLADPEQAAQWVSEGSKQWPDEVVIEEVQESDWPDINRIEAAAYEPERQDSEESLRRSQAAGVGLLARRKSDGEVLGFCFGGHLEKFKTTSGPDHDVYQDTGEGFYSADVTVAPTAQSMGVGRKLKRAQLEWARDQGLRWATGRNRVGVTQEMSGLNRSFGAWVVERLTGQYGGNAEADYYRIPLSAPRMPDKDAQAQSGPGTVDLASGLQAPFGPAPGFMAEREMVGPASCRLNLSNWATLDAVQYVEYLRAVAPRGTGHMYFTSSQDEMVDKVLRALKLHRPSGTLAIGVEGAHFGHVTAAARSLSDPRGYGQHFALFDWPKLPHPAEDADASVAALSAIVEREGAESILGFFVELVGERSGQLFEGASASTLAAECRRHDIPLVVVETASGGFRNGATRWGVDELPEDVVPDAVLWYPGGQLGHVFAGDAVWIEKPLTLISTWDGDEVSIIRAHEHLEYARHLELGPATRALDELLNAVVPEGAYVGGRGLYRSVRFSDAAESQRRFDAAASAGVRLGRGLPDTLLLVPALDVDPAFLFGDVRERLLQAWQG